MPRVAEPCAASCSIVAGSSRFPAVNDFRDLRGVGGRIHKINLVFASNFAETTVFMFA